MKKLLLVSLCFIVLCVTQVFAQNRTITGTVTAKEDGLPIPGATVRVKGTATAAATDVNGKYSIAAAPNSTLVFSYVAYSPQEIAVGGKTTINVVLVQGNKQLNEVVVTSYGTGTRVANLVGTVAVISGKDLQNKPSPNALDALQGRVSGLNVLSSSGEPTSTPSLTLHGISSLGAGSTPFIILDGVPVDISTIISLNQNDIQDLQVLKDAASTSIYGSRASNGVIRITTKTGALNQPAKITVSSQYGVSKLANTDFFNNFMNSAQFEAFQVESGQLTQTQLNQTLAALPVKNADTKWYKVYYKDNTPFYNENVSIAGGGEKTTYFVSAGYLKDAGIAYRSAYDRYTLRSNVESTVNSWLKFGLKLSLGYDERETNPSGTNSTNLGLALLAAPYYSAIDPNGKPYISIPGWGHYSPSYRASVFKDNNNNTQINPSAFVELTPISGLTIRTQAGMDDYDYRETTLQLPSYLGSVGNGKTTEFFTRGTSKTFTNTAEYKFNVAKVNHFSALFGQEYTDGFTNVFNASTTGQSNDLLTQLSAGPNNITVSNVNNYDNNATTTKTGGVGDAAYVYNSLFGTLNYDYNERYFVEGSIRSDKSSRFGINHQTGTFWSAGVSWKAKEEDFLKDVSWLNELTVRANTGTTGNSEIGNYPSLATVSSVSYGNSNGYSFNSPGNPNLTWESQRLTTIGINTTVLEVVHLDLSYYIRKTSNMLIDVPFAYTSGFGSVTSNTGTLQHKGADINLTVDVWKDPAHKGYFSPFIIANIDHNKVTSLFQGKDFWVVPNTGVSWVIGQPVNYFEPIYKGVNSQTGAPEWYLPNPGEEGPKTTRKDPKAVTSEFNSTALQQNTGVSQYPWLTGSFGFNAGYQGFYASALFIFNVGKHITDNDRYFYENPNQFPGYNQTKRVANYWKKPGDVALFPDVNNYQFTQFDSQLLENASFMRLKDLTIGYTLPQSILAHTKVIKGAKIYVDGRNLLTVTKYLGSDPEVDSNIALGNYPNTKQYSLGVEVTF